MTSPSLLLIVAITVIASQLAVHSVQAGWSLTWSDEFNGPKGRAPDGGKWQFEIGDKHNGWGNWERQYYTSDRSNSALDGSGNLIITARKADRSINCYYGRCEYTSARLRTFKKFEQKYGKFEARIKIPRGKGIWPAFWMLGSNIESVNWPTCGEIDIMEIRGSQSGTVSSAIHGPGFSGGEGIAAGYTIPNGKSLSNNYHIYSVEWTNRKFSFKIDGREYHAVSRDSGRLNGKRWVFDRPFYLLLNLAVGGLYDGSPNSETRFPQKMIVDYVRAYRQT